MRSPDEMQQMFHDAYRQCAEKNHGALIPEEAAALMAGMLGMAQMQEEFLQLLRSPEVSSSVYPDVIPAMQEIVRTPGQGLSFWTQGEYEAADGTPGYQQLKIQASGIPEALAPHWEELVDQYGIPPIIGDLDKLSVLPQFKQAAIGRFDRVVVVDDRSKNLVKARQLLEDPELD